MNPIRVLLAEDHTLVRAGIRALLQTFQHVEVVAEAEDGREALNLAQQHRPDVVLMDIRMKGLNGLEATARIIKECPHTRVIILSMYTDEEFVLQALRSGAAGYLLKDSAANELELALQAAVRNETYLSPAVSKHVVDPLRQGAENREPRSLERLTSRQREVLQLIAEGHTTREIADLLHLSSNTIVTHRMQLMERLDIHDVAGLVRYAIRTGLIAPNE